MTNSLRYMESLLLDVFFVSLNFYDYNFFVVLNSSVVVDHHRTNRNKSKEKDIKMKTR
jgi:hypothetical protein